MPSRKFLLSSPLILLLIPYSSYFLGLLLPEYIVELIGICIPCICATVAFRGTRIVHGRLITLCALNLFLLCLVTAIPVFRAQKDPAVFLFLSPYIAFCFILLCACCVPFTVRNSRKLPLNILFWLSFCGSLVSLAGLLQYLGLLVIPPLDGFRARGLSRHTIQFSSLLLVSFYANELLSFFRPHVSHLFRTALVIGIICSLSRGAIGSIFLFFLFRYAFPFLAHVFVSRAITRSSLSYLILLAVVVGFGLRRLLPSAAAMASRLLSTFDFATDATNLERVSSWTLYLDNISILGVGLGSVGSGASKLSSGAVLNFESFLLGLIYQGGLFQLIFLPAFILILVRVAPGCSSERESSSLHPISLSCSLHKQLSRPSPFLRTWIIAASLSLLPQLFSQATFENPTALTLLSMVLFSYLRLSLPLDNPRPLH